MREQDLPRALEILAQWNMVPRAPSAEVPQPEIVEVVVANGFVAEVEGRVVGCCSYVVRPAGVCETSSFALDPDYTGRGIGFTLQAARLQEMKRMGAQRVITETDRPETVRWYLTNFPYRITRTRRKRHAWGDPAIDECTELELDLDDVTGN